MGPTSTIACPNHPDLPVAAYCRTCGKPLCAACRRNVGSTVFCAEHAPPGASSGATPRSGGAAPSGATSPVNDSPYTAPTPPIGVVSHNGAPPVLAFLLGFIPGVGAIFNGQYAKGLVHAVVFGLLITAISSHSHGFEPLLGILIAVFVFYMAIEAYHTARKRASGEPIEEFSSLAGVSDGFPIGAVVLIGLGVILLLNTLNLIPMEIVFRFWPLGLIVIGGYMLYSRMRGVR